MRFIPLASSSAGNAYIVDDGESRILLECGLTFKKLQKLSGFNLRVAGCLVTHEHGDHAKCYPQLLKNGVRVYATEGTRDALEEPLLDVMERDGADAYKEFLVGSFRVLPFRTFHDAREPVGFLIQSRADGDKLAFATDTVNLAYQFPGVGVMAIECNHSDYLVKRIAELPKDKVKHLKRASNTHMSLSRAYDFILNQRDKSWLREVWLLHLSDAFSDEETFRQAMEFAVSETGGRVTLRVAPKEISV